MSDDLARGRKVIAGGIPGEIVTPPGDGRVYVRRVDGITASYPLDQVTPADDKDHPAAGGLEHK
jgi:hypothetical protein